MMRNRLMAVVAAAAVSALTVACAGSNDPAITTSVKSQLAADDVVKAYKIDVDTRDRVVTLTGAVDSSLAKERAVQIARKAEGVNNVIDNLTISPGGTATTGVDDALQQRGAEAAADARERGSEAGRQADEKMDRAQDKAGDAANRAGEAIGDASITAAVKSKLLADPDVSGLKIDVDTSGGVVTLRGNVTSAAEKTRALELAKKTDGVKSVRDQIKVVR